jgi:hypothetical protein
MSDYLLRKDFRDYAFKGDKSSELAKAIDDKSLTAEEYKSLQKHYTGDKTGEEAEKAEAEFHAAMVSTFGSSVSYLREPGTSAIPANVVKLDEEIVAVDNNISITDGVSSLVPKDDSDELAARVKNDRKAIYYADSIIRATQRIPPNYKEVYETLKDLREMTTKGEVSPVILTKTENSLRETLVNLANGGPLLFKKENKEAFGKLLAIDPPLMAKDSDTMISLYKKLRDEKPPVLNISPINNDAKVDLSFKGKTFLTTGVNGFVPLFYGSVLPPANGTSVSVPLAMSLLGSDSVSLGPVLNGANLTGFGGTLTYGKVDVNISFHQTQKELNGIIPPGFFGGLSVVTPFPSY